MSSSWNTEEELRRLAQELYAMAGDLETAASILEDMRTTEGIKEKVRSLKQRAADWMKP